MEYLRLYLPLCRFKGNPLSLPKSVSFLKYNLIFYYCIELFMQLNMIDDPFEAVVDISCETLLSLAFVACTLALNRSMDKFVQVASAMLVSENILACLALPIVAWITMSESILSYLLLGALFFWNLLIISYIFNLVLRINVLASLIMGVLYFMVTYIGTFYLSTLSNL